MRRAPTDLQRVLAFIQRLEDSRLHYALGSIRADSLLVIVTVPGQRWEVEFMADGSVQIEKFLSDGTIYDETALVNLFSEFSEDPSSADA